MMLSNRLVLLIAVIGFHPLLASAQPEPSPVLKAQREAMDELEFMVGEWKGTGWMDVGGRRSTFESSETVESRLDGLALVIEGTHTSDVPGSAEPVVVHHAVAMLTYHAGTGLYRFNTQVHRGGTGTYDGHMKDGAFVWQMNRGDAQIRYTIRIDENGHWHEIGEYSTDDAKWTQFFEMTLQRAD